MSTQSPDAVRDQVRRRYAEAALAAAAGSAATCCADSCCTAEAATEEVVRAAYTIEERGELPEAATLASLGCGNPTAVAELNEGRPCSTSAPAEASTSSSRRSASGRAGSPTAST